MPSAVSSSSSSSSSTASGSWSTTNPPKTSPPPQTEGLIPAKPVVSGPSYAITPATAAATTTNTIQQQTTTTSTVFRCPVSFWERNSDGWPKQRATGHLECDAIGGRWAFRPEGRGVPAKMLDISRRDRAVEFEPLRRREDAWGWTPKYALLFTPPPHTHTHTA